MRITRVYTRAGDDGSTGLATGERVSKASARVAAYGDVDELNSLLGLARCCLRDEELSRVLEKIQNELFVLGADLATPLPPEGMPPEPKDAWIAGMRRTTAAEVRDLEATIDRYNEQLAPLEEFILPGGCEAGARLHVARAVARRAERAVAALAAGERINAQTLIYLNRLSDLLFVLARYANKQSGTGEQPANFRS